MNCSVCQVDFNTLAAYVKHHRDLHSHSKHFRLICSCGGSFNTLRSLQTQWDLPFYHWLSFSSLIVYEFLAGIDFMDKQKRHLIWVRKKKRTTRKMTEKMTSQAINKDHSARTCRCTISIWDLLRQAMMNEEETLKTDRSIQMMDRKHGMKRNSWNHLKSVCFIYCLRCKRCSPRRKQR